MRIIRKKFHRQLHDLVEKIRTFEISKRVSMISLAVILVVYVGLSTPELFLDESSQWSDYDAVLIPALEIWPFGESDDIYIQEQNDRYVQNVFA